MPELLGPGERSGADAIWYPTNWRTSDGDIIMPVPTVDVVDEPATPLPERVFFHTCGEAMLDRNGTEIVRQALAYVTQRCTVLLRCGEHVDAADWPSGPHGNVSIHVMPPADHYRNVFPFDAEVLLMPRRYGGLCLPVQEAAARGIPSIMSDLSPQNEWPGVATVRAEVLQQTVEMKGGWFPVHHVDPREYAAAIDRWADPDNVAELHKHAHAAHEWAVEHEWVRWRGRYTRALQAVAEAA
jgi:glycosyltransferase involved in cell wall biosynthesis